MKTLFYIFVGALVAGIVFGSWWLTFGAGVCALCFQRSYVVLASGVFLDVIFLPVTADIFFSFYTATFLVITVLAEFIRRQLFIIA